MRRRRAAVAIAALTLVATGCAANAVGAKTGTSGARSTTTTLVSGCQAPEIKFGTGQLGPASPTTTVPVERGSRSINPSNDAGQAVIIDKGGFLLPEWLVAEVTLPITWTNLSGVPQEIIFDAAPVCSSVIAPGGTFTWKSPGFAIGLTYHTANGHHARLTLQNPNTP